MKAIHVALGCQLAVSLVAAVGMVRFSEHSANGATLPFSENFQDNTADGFVQTSPQPGGTIAGTGYSVVERAPGDFVYNSLVAKSTGSATKQLYSSVQIDDLGPATPNSGFTIQATALFNSSQEVMSNYFGIRFLGATATGGNDFYLADVKTDGLVRLTRLRSTGNSNSTAYTTVDSGTVATLVPGTTYNFTVNGYYDADGNLDMDYTLVGSDGFHKTVTWNTPETAATMNTGQFFGFRSFIGNEQYSGAATGVLSVDWDNFSIAAIPDAVAGDFDGDGDVDGADFVAWQTNFPKATGAVLSEGDADGDGDVDGADFVVWQTNFPFSPGPGVAPVPEPSALLTGITAMVLPLFAIRRFRAV